MSRISVFPYFSEGYVVEIAVRRMGIYEVPIHFVGTPAISKSLRGRICKESYHLIPQLHISRVDTSILSERANWPYTDNASPLSN